MSFLMLHHPGRVAVSTTPPETVPPVGSTAKTVIVALPTPSGVTRPVELTEKMAGLSETQVSVLSGTPGPSRSPGLSWVGTPPVAGCGDANTVTVTVRVSDVPGIDTVTTALPTP